MSDQAPTNLYNERLQVKHADLERFGDSAYKSQCPVCSDGVLLVMRDQENFKLVRYDFCVTCGQPVEYLDIDEMNQRESHDQD